MLSNSRTTTGKKTDGKNNSADYNATNRTDFISDAEGDNVLDRLSSISSYCNETKMISNKMKEKLKDPKILTTSRCGFF